MANEVTTEAPLQRGVSEIPVRSLSWCRVQMPDGTVARVIPGSETRPVEIQYEVEIGREDYTERGTPMQRAVRKQIPHFYIWRDEQLPHLEAWRTGLRVLGWDTETSGISVYEHHVATEQFGNPVCDDPRAYVVDVRGLSRDGIRRLMSVVEDPTVMKLGQNIKFECLYAQHRLGVEAQNVACTQATELLIRAGLLQGGKVERAGGTSDGQDKKAYSQCSMKALSFHYQRIDIDKDQDLRTSFYTTPCGEHSVRQVLYAGGDTIHPFYIAEGQRPEVARRNLKQIQRLEFEFIPVLVDLELNGIGMDQLAWKRLWQDAVKRMDAAERALDEEFLRVAQPSLDLGLDLQDQSCWQCAGLGHIGPVDNTCGHCKGSGRGKSQHVRPMYQARGKKSAEPLNWSSSTQIKWAITRYCEAVGWPVQLITTETQLLKAKRITGRDWCMKKGIDPQSVTDPYDIPDWVLDEDRYCVLLSAEYDVLKLRKLYGQLPAKLVDLILAYADEKSLTTTYGIDFLKNVKADGRVHVEFHQLIAATGRMSSTPNLQAIPRLPAYRKCFVPRKGYVFVIADYSSIEPRISAQVSGDPVYVANFLANGDLYVSVGQELFGRTIDKKTEQGAEDRQAAKQVVLSLAYRAGARALRDAITLQLNRAVTFDYAQTLHRTFLEKCAAIREFQERCTAEADPKSGQAQKLWDSRLACEVTYVASRCGRLRFFPPDAKGLYTEPCNFPIQALSATITKSAGVMLRRHIREQGYDARPCNFIHDEIVYEVRADQAERFAVELKQIMEAAAQHYLPDIPVKAEFPEGSTTGVVPYWAKEFHEERAA